VPLTHDNENGPPERAAGGHHPLSTIAHCVVEKWHPSLSAESTLATLATLARCLRANLLVALISLSRSTLLSLSGERPQRAHEVRGTREALNEAPAAMDLGPLVADETVSA
jgi:hypothetical protein